MNTDELDLAYNLLTEESNRFIGQEKYGEFYFPLLYAKLLKEYELGNYIESITLSKNLIASYNKTDSLLAYAYVYLGNSYYRFDDYDIALDCYFKAAEIQKNLKRYNAYSRAIANVGLIYIRLGNFEKALGYYTQAINIRTRNNLKPDPLNYNNIARIFIRQKIHRTALLYLDSALHIAKQQNNSLQEYYSLRNKGFSFNTQKKYKEAIEYYTIAVEGYRSIHSMDDVLECIEHLSSIYIKIRKYDKAIELCETNLPMAYSTNNLRQVVALSNKLYRALVAKGSYKEAVFVEQNFSWAKDSINQKQLENNKYKVQMRFEAEKRANENKILKKQRETDEETIRAQNILLYSVCFGLVLVILIALIIYRSYVTNKKLTTKIQEQSDRLKQLDAAKSRFFANISHDLRTPLTLIMGGIEQVLKSKDLLLTKKAEQQLKTGLLNGERIIHLTNEINELIKLEDGKLIIHKKYVNIDKMLKLFVKMFSSMAELKGIHLSYSKSIFEDFPIIHIDPSQFEKVLFNLITNALKHTKTDDSVTISLNKKENDIIISVIDSGEGIPEQNIPYIFERYYQAPETTFKTQEGFGIGLALVKEIVQKHGARIEVKSKLQEGTEFIITMPLQHVSTEEVTNLPDLDFTSKTRGLFQELDEPISEQTPVVNILSNKVEESERKTVLIVEDHPEVREFIRNIIESNYHVLSAPNGKRALKILDKSEVDLIITDLMMPWFDGFELLEKLKESDKLKKIPALVLSARTSEEDKSKVLSQGVNDFLCKPFKPDELLLRMENLLNQKELWNNNNEAALFINNQETLDEIEKSLIKKVESLVIERIDDANLSVNFLADQIAVSERKFYRMIKKMTGSTPYEFIKEIRMQYANRILKEKTISSASEIAKAIGMNNVSHFNKQFKKRFGKNPAEYI